MESRYRLSENSIEQQECLPDEADAEPSQPRLPKQESLNEEAKGRQNAWQEDAKQEINDTELKLLGKFKKLAGNKAAIKAIQLHINKYLDNHNNQKQPENHENNPIAQSRNLEEDSSDSGNFSFAKFIEGSYS